MKTWSLQSSFNNGVLDERIAARLDIKQYFQGLSIGDNLVCLPQGGVRRRPGSQYIDDADAGTVRLAPFVFNTDQSYLLVFTDLQVKIYRDDALVDTVVTPYLAADLVELDFAQTADTMIIVHEDYQPRTLVRGATDADFTLSTITFAYIPQYDFNDSSSPSPTSQIQRVDFNNDYQDGDTFVLGLDGVETVPIAFEEDSSADGISRMENDISNALLELVNTGNDGVTVTHYGGSEDKYDITFSGASADDWPKMSWRNEDGKTISNNDISISITQAGSPRKEDVWSATRGWPRTVTFFEGRVWFGGAYSRPHTIWGSRVNNFYNFDPGTQRPNHALDITLDADQVNRVQSIVGGRALTVFTIGGEFVFKEAATDPITPENVAVVPQTAIGSKRIQPVAVGGSLMYIQRTGKAVREFLYDDNQQAYDSGSLTLLNPSIISDPTEMQVQKGTESDDATYVYLLNNDGTLAVFNTDPNNDIAAWSKWEANSGTYISVAVVLDDVYVVVDRDSNYFIEKFDYDYFLDSSVKFSGAGATTTLTGLDHLDGYEVRVRVNDGHMLPNETVASGQITIPMDPDTAEVGFCLQTNATTMPVVQNPGGGYDLDNEIRVSRVTLELFESRGISVNGYDLGLNETFTGRKSIVLLGWSKRPTVTISQCDPQPMTLLGINLEVNG